MLQYVICDDERQYLDAMLSALKVEGESEQHVALVTSDPNDVLAYASRAQGNTLYFLDLQLDDAKTPAGLSLCQRVLAADPGAYVVFVSAHPQYALDCCRSHAFDFLVKPFSQAELSACVNAVAADITMRSGRIPLVVKAGSRVVQLDQRHILHFSRDNDFVTAHMPLNELHWRESFASLLPRLHEGMFLRIHNSHIISLNHVKEVDAAEGCVVLTDGSSVPISRRSRKQIIAALRPHYAQQEA